ncbi:tissue factor-like [Arapaima gigas]
MSPELDSCWTLLAFLLSLLGETSGDFPKATNVTWSSLNFKTILMWRPEPTNYSYTVEFSITGKNRDRNPHCIKTTDTECDLTNMLTQLNETYTADVISEPKQGVTSDVVEFPHTRAAPFCPYKNSSIGQPDFNIQVNKDESKITLFIIDPVSAIYKDGRQLNMRDIFKNDLKYKVIYRKAGTTGKREKISDSSVLELDVDKGMSYCFNIQAYIPSRVTGTQLGELSTSQCSPAGDKPFYEEYSIGVISGAILAVLAILITALVLTVVCCRRCRKAADEGKEALPLQNLP